MFFFYLSGDGDSSTEALIRSGKPYGALFMVQKVDCKNHILRNFRSHLLTLADNTKLPCPEGVTAGEMQLLRKVLRDNVLRMSAAISKACLHRGEVEKGSNLSYILTLYLGIGFWA